MRKNKKEELMKLRALQSYVLETYPQLLDEFEMAYRSNEVTTSTISSETAEDNQVKVKDDNTLFILADDNIDLTWIDATADHTWLDEILKNNNI